MRIARYYVISQLCMLRRFSILGPVRGVKGQTLTVLTLCSHDFELGANSVLLRYSCGRTKNHKCAITTRHGILLKWFYSILLMVHPCSRRGSFWVAFSLIWGATALSIVGRGQWHLWLCLWYKTMIIVTMRMAYPVRHGGGGGGRLFEGTYRAIH